MREAFWAGSCVRFARVYRIGLCGMARGRARGLLGARRNKGEASFSSSTFSWSVGSVRNARPIVERESVIARGGRNLKLCIGYFGASHGAENGSSTDAGSGGKWIK